MPKRDTDSRQTREHTVVFDDALVVQHQSVGSARGADCNAVGIDAMQKFGGIGTCDGNFVSEELSNRLTRERVCATSRSMADASFGRAGKPRCATTEYTSSCAPCSACQSQRQTPDQPRQRAWNRPASAAMLTGSYGDASSSCRRAGDTSRIWAASTPH